MTVTDSASDVEVQADDPNNSVRIDWDIGLEPRFSDLLDKMTQETINYHDIPRARPSSVRQIRTTIDCLLANLLRAYLGSPSRFVALPLATRDYIRTRYRNRGIGYDNLRLVIGYLLHR